MLYLLFMLFIEVNIFFFFLSLPFFFFKPFPLIPEVSFFLLP